MKVREHIDFQRGLDPKESMDIGNKNYQIVNKTQKYLDKFAPGSKVVSTLPSDKKWLDWEPIQKWELPNKGWLIIEFDGVQYWFTWGDRLGNVNSDWAKKLLALKSPVWIEEVLDSHGNSMIKSIDHLKEGSLDFQRGLDPKKAMKIGKNFLQYKKGDKVKVWVPWEKRLVEVRVYEDEELDTDGNPRIKKMVSNTKPAWPVRRIWIRYNGEVRTANLAIDPDLPEMDRWVLHQ